MIFALDLEGVLAPEIWPLLGQRFGVPEFSLTTRDLGDFDELMRRRVAGARAAGVTLADLQSVAHAVEPYIGAREFVARLKTMGNVVIISDTFHEFSDPLANKLGGTNLFANRFELDERGRLRGFKLRLRGGRDGRQPERSVPAQIVRLPGPLPAGGRPDRAVPGEAGGPASRRCPG